MTEIRCPPTCAYLASAREHPPAVIARQQQRDVALLAHTIRDFSDRQADLFVTLTQELTRHEAPGLHRLLDVDIEDAVAAAAATFETAARGVIYDHKPESLPAQRLAAVLSARLAESGRNGGSAFERDAAFVLRRIEETVRQLRLAESPADRAFLDLIGRTLRRPGDQSAPATGPETLILP